MRRRVLLPLAVAAALAAGAAAGAGAQEPGSEPPDPEIASGEEQRALDAARARWRSLRLRDYRMRLTLSCFCGPPAGTERRLVVLRGRPVRPPEGLRHAATVPRLHRIVQEAIDDRAVQLDVRYDRRGIPRSIYVDRQRFVADEEVGYTVRRFAAGRARR